MKYILRSFGQGWFVDPYFLAVREEKKTNTKILFIKIHEINSDNEKGMHDLATCSTHFHYNCMVIFFFLFFFLYFYKKKKYLLSLFVYLFI